MSQRLSFEFWNRHPLVVAEQLPGCILSMTTYPDKICQAKIIETEAYSADEAACHAYQKKQSQRSPRIAQFFGPPGRSYIYLNYGIHKLLNIITGPEAAGGSVLIRAVEPVVGSALMRERRGAVKDVDLTNGPGKLTQAMGIGLEYNDIDICDPRSPLVIFDKDCSESVALLCGPRVGISKAQELEWRFAISGSSYISKAKENIHLRAY